MAALRVDCESCKSRFRLDTSLFQGAKAIRVRCRRCGAPIIVRNPDPPAAAEVPQPPAAPCAADVTFDSMAELWQALYREVRNGRSGSVDVRKTEEYVAKHDISIGSFAALTEIGASYLRLIGGAASGNSVAEDAVRRDLGALPRLLNMETGSDLPAEALNAVEKALEETFYLGLAAHLILSEHPHRHKVGGMAKEGLYLDFLEACRFADKDMREYNKDMNGLPAEIFKAHFARQVEPLFAESLSLGFWRMGKVRSYFRNLYFGGIALGVLSDGHAEEYLVNA